MSGLLLRGLVGEASAALEDFSYLVGVWVESVRDVLFGQRNKRLSFSRILVKLKPVTKRFQK